MWFITIGVNVKSRIGVLSLYTVCVAQRSLYLSINYKFYKHKKTEGKKVYDNVLPANLWCINIWPAGNLRTTAVMYVLNVNSMINHCIRKNNSEWK